MKIALVTASKKTLQWKSLSKKLEEIKKVLNTAKNSDFKIDCLFIDVKPEVVNGRITSKWFDTLTAQHKDYDFVLLHFSAQQKKEWGILDKLGGSSFRDEDMIGEGWFYADENSKRKGHIRFVETFLHEMSHLIARGTMVTDRTHEEDAKKGTVKALFKTYDMSLWMVAQKKKLLEYLLSLVKAKQTLLHPVLEFKNYITQEYGVANAWYPLTGHHIGTDYGTPVGTPLKAPWPGKVTISGYSASLGNYCVYEYVFKAQKYQTRFMHLVYVPKQGNYARGDLIGQTGGTGNVSGAHLHVDIFLNEIRLDLLSKSNWMKLTVNPKEHYESI